MLLQLTGDCMAQTSMSGIAVSDDAVNMYYFLKAKSTVRTKSPDMYSCDLSHLLMY